MRTGKMCEILLNVRTAGSSVDPVVQAGILQPWDVVWVAADGNAWSGPELNKSEWRILKVPNIPVANYTALVNPDAGGSAPRARGYNLDLSGATGALATYLADDTRAAAAFTTTNGVIQAALKQKAAPGAAAVVRP